MSHRETNPHFSRPLRPQHVRDRDHVPVQPPRSHEPPVQHQLPNTLPLEDHPQPNYQPPRSRVTIEEPAAPYKPHASPIPQHQHDPRHTPHTDQVWQPRSERRQPPHEHRGHRHGLRVPKPRTTKPYTWFGAIFCVIFCLVIIIGGLIVLIVYLVFRPQSPRFEVSSVTLNAAYLDLGYLLNADVTVLANFTNPNKRVHVDFSSMNIYLYYGSTVIATQYVQPFSAAKAESRFANIHMVTSQVQLPLGETQRLIKQMESNGIMFNVKGIFRARSKLGSILRYSYNLYGYCTIMVTRPPDGVLIRRKCRTKR